MQRHLDRSRALCAAQWRDPCISPLRLNLHLFLLLLLFFWLLSRRDLLLFLLLLFFLSFPLGICFCLCS